MKILFIGDVVARLGRETVGKVLPGIISKEKIDLVIANAENSAHGKGASKSTLDELSRYGVDFFTGGNHIFWNKKFTENMSEFPIVRPSNYINAPGSGYKEIDLGVKGKILVINLVGVAFMPSLVTSNPFIHIEDLLQNINPEDYRAIIVDFHAEASSEKVLMGQFLDGKVSAVLGTHWHVPTADNRVLDNGTAYVSDVGMVGAQNESLGVDKEIAFQKLKSPLPSRNEWVEEGTSMFNSVLIELGNVGMKAKSITRLDVWNI